VDLESIVKALNLKVISGNDKLKKEVRGGYAGDLLSDVMANSKEGDIWITRQVHPNIIAVSSLKDHAGIIIVQGNEPMKNTLDRAIKENVPIMVSDLPGFETIGKIYHLLTEKH